MADKIQRINKGQPPSLLNAELANRVIDSCNAFRTMEVFGASFSFFGDRASLIIAPQSGGGSTAKFPFGIYAASTETQLRVRIRPGLVNGITPTVDDVPITDEDHFLIISETASVYLQGTVSEDEDNYGNLVSAEILAAPQLPTATFANPVIQLGSVTVASGAITAISQDVFASLQLIRFFQNYVWALGGPSAP